MKGSKPRLGAGSALAGHRKDRTMSKNPPSKVSLSQTERTLVSFSLWLTRAMSLVLLLMLVVGCTTSEERIQRRVEVLLQEGSRDANDEIVEIGTPAVESLIVALEHQKTSTRRGAAYALGKIGDTRARDPLFQAFFEPGFADVDSTRMALIALVELGHPRAVDAAVIANAERRGGETAREVVSNAGPEAREALLRLLKHESADVREQVLRELTRGGFLDTLESETGHTIVNILITDKFWLRGKNWDLSDEILGQMGPLAVESLAAVIEQTPSKLNDTAIRHLSAIGNLDAAEVLVDILEDAPRSMRSTVLEALLDIAEREPTVARAALQTSVDTLIAMAANTSDLAVQKSAAQLLVCLGGSRALDALMEGLAAYAGQKRQTVFIEMLGELGDPGAITALVALLGDENEKIRKSVVIALADIDHPRVVEPLVGALGDNERDIRETAAYRLNVVDERNLEPLLEGLRKRDPLIVSKAYLFFLVRGEPGSEEILVEAIRRYGTKEMAVDYLNSGHEPLEEAAKAWAQNNGYIITGLPSFEDPPRWPDGR